MINFVFLVFETIPKLEKIGSYPKDYVSNEDNLTTDGVPQKKKVKNITKDDI